MTTIITIIHVLACVFLVLVVLLQTGKGADMGAVFGGSSATVFGSSGAGTFLSRLTAAMAAVFMVTSLTLTYMSARRVTSTVFDSAPLSAPPPVEQPATGEPAGQSAAPAPQAAAEGPAQPAAPVAPAANAPAPAQAPAAGSANAPAPAAPAPPGN